LFTTRVNNFHPGDDNAVITLLKNEVASLTDNIRLLFALDSFPVVKSGLSIYLRTYNKQVIVLLSLSLYLP
jgi:hypothetical protein